MEEDKNSSVVLLNKTEENEEIKEVKKTKSKLEKILLIITIIVLLVAIFSTIFALVNMKNDKIIKGTKIAQVDVSNMTKEEARKVLEEIYSLKNEKEIYLTYGEFETTTTYKALEVNFKIAEAVEQAYEIGRKGNLVKDNFAIIKDWIEGTEINLEAKIDDDMINQVAQNINNSIEGAVVQSSYYRKDGENTLIITAGNEGLQVDNQKLYEKLYEIVTEQVDTDLIEIPLINVQPDKIDIEKIHQEVYKKEADAYYTTNPFTIYPEVEGVDFDIENAKLLLEEEKEEYEIPLIITKPNKTTKDIGTEAFPDLLATFSTKYQASNVNRTTNLRLASNKINGTVLLPGEEFSYNKTVGERTVAAGFKEAAVFNAGKVENGLGGGICQISSTLYDAVVMANLDVTVRRNHQFVTSYVKAGADATVVWGSQDFKFKNSRTYPIRITSTVQGGVATIQIWGVKEETEYEITIETKKTATIPYTTQYIQTSNLPAGQQKVVQAGSNGQKIEAYKVTKLNGQVISRTLLSKDTYNAMKKIVQVGTAQ